MYARLVEGNFKPGKYDFATKTLEKEVIPLLRKQPGFRDEISFFNQDLGRGYAISFWENKADLEHYAREVYPKVREKMAEAYVDLPMVKEFEVSNSTWHKIHAM